MMKNQKGITLIALVITIIVLLILAGVSIAMLTGENGLLTRANESKVETVIGEALDKANMEANAQFANVLAGKGFDSKDTINANLMTTAKEGVKCEVTTEPSADSGLTITITVPTGYTLTTSTATVKKDASSGKWTMTPAAR